MAEEHAFKHWESTAEERLRDKANREADRLIKAANYNDAHLPDNYKIFKSGDIHTLVYIDNDERYVLNQQPVLIVTDQGHIEFPYATISQLNKFLEHTRTAGLEQYARSSLKQSPATEALTTTAAYLPHLAVVFDLKTGRKGIVTRTVTGQHILFQDGTTKHITDMRQQFQIIACAEDIVSLYLAQLN